MKKLLKKAKKMTLDTLGTEMRQGFKTINKRLTGVDQKFDGLENKMDRGFAGVALRFDLMDAKFDKKIDDLAAMTQRQFLAVNDRFDNVDKKIGDTEEIKKRITAIEKRLPESRKN